jgi:hypothetical protein
MKKTHFARTLMVSIIIAFPSFVWTFSDAHAQSGKVCFFTNENFQGTAKEKLCANPGDKIDVYGEDEYNHFNDKFKSVRVPNGLSVTVYTDDDFYGWAQPFTTDVPKFVGKFAGTISAFVVKEVADACEAMKKDHSNSNVSIAIKINVPKLLGDIGNPNSHLKLCDKGKTCILGKYVTDPEQFAKYFADYIEMREGTDHHVCHDHSIRLAVDRLEKGEWVIWWLNADDEYVDSVNLINIAGSRSDRPHDNPHFVKLFGTNVLYPSKEGLHKGHVCAQIKDEASENAHYFFDFSLTTPDGKTTTFEWDPEIGTVPCKE